MVLLQLAKIQKLKSDRKSYRQGVTTSIFQEFSGLLILDFITSTVTPTEARITLFEANMTHSRRLASISLPNSVQPIEGVSSSSDTLEVAVLF